MEPRVFPDFLAFPVDIVAQRLLGCRLLRTIDGQTVTVRIVETEAYDQDDPASHAFRGETPRNRVMFGPPGYLYVYFTYGMHYCCNVATGPAGHGSGVLIRAVEPVDGLDLLERRRGLTGVQLTNGPAKLCQALGIDRELNGHDLRLPPVELQVEGLRPGETISQSPRIGISKATDLLRRFHITGNPYVSRGPKRLDSILVPRVDPES
jgi:DNA-3-methyladenine glycosylase